MYLWTWRDDYVKWKGTLGSNIFRMITLLKSIFSLPLRSPSWAGSSVSFTQVCPHFVIYSIPGIMTWVHMHAESLQSCDPIDYSLPDSSVHGILQARILEWLAISFSRGSFPSRDRTGVYCICCFGRWILYHWATSMIFQGLVLKASIFFT